jgi:HEPN domain
MTLNLGGEDYRETALSRLNEAELLYDQQQWVGCIYLAGRAVESVLRSMLWSPQWQLDTGHDLPKTLDRIRGTGILRTEEQDRFTDWVNDLSVVWRNDLRFTGSRRFARLLRQSGRHLRIGAMTVKGDPSKANAKRAKDIAREIVARGEPICRKRYNKN